MFMPGDEFPGDLHRERIARYDRHRKLMKGLYDAALGIDAVLATFGQDYLHQIRKEALQGLLDEVRIIANLPRTITKRLAGMTVSGLSITSTDQRAGKALEDSLAASSWSRMRRTVGYRSLTYGNAILTVRRDEQKMVYVDQRDPWTWFPTVDPYNAADAIANVFAWTVKRGDVLYLLQEEHAGSTITRAANLLESSVKGKDERAAVVVGAKVGRSVDWREIAGADAPPESENTGLAVPLVGVVQSWSEDETVYGESILNGNESLIAEITNRLSRIAVILDKHSDPKLSGPADATTRNQDGSRSFRVSDGYFPRSPEDVEFKYLVWESQLDHAQAELERVVGLLCAQMDMNPDLIGLPLNKGAGVEATDTLRIRSFSTISAVGDQRDFMTDGLRDMARAIVALNGLSPTVPINIVFGDPLPLSSKERADLIQAERMAGIVSRETAIKRLHPDMPDEEVAAELKRIDDEESAVFNPGQA